MPRIPVSEETAPAKVVAAARRLGNNIRTARKRRRLRQKDLATQAGINVQTLRRVEGGSLGTAVGAYIAALWAMGLENQLTQLAEPATDLEGKTLEAAARGERVRPRALSSDF
ncbi:MAG: helix-turn-helix domain-containing protein [Gemmatimonadota bacterium]|nr:helix-turn-helix domain-containing protein [Gemmatimonadota bacterium]MDH3421453.1 helix-turn-helix domain-containing protein [Gemmatimonadota bacterium]